MRGAAPDNLGHELLSQQAMPEKHNKDQEQLLYNMGTYIEHLKRVPCTCVRAVVVALVTVWLNPPRHLSPNTLSINAKYTSCSN